MARGPHEKNFSGDIPNALADEVEEFITSHRDVKKKQILAVALDLFMSLPETAQAILAFTRRGEAGFQGIIAKVTMAMAENNHLNITTAYSTITSAITSYPILSDIDKASVDEFLDAMRSILAADLVPAPNLPVVPSPVREAQDIPLDVAIARVRTASTQYQLLSPAEQKWLDALRDEAIAAQRSMLAAVEDENAAALAAKEQKGKRGRRPAKGA